QVSDAADPAAIVALQETEGSRELELVSCAEAPLVYQLAGNGPGPFRVHYRRQYGLAFRKRLLCEECSGKIQFTKRPYLLVAERAQIPGHFVDLIQCQRFGVRRHDLGPSTLGSALVKRGGPVVGLV